ncbi:MULTISPECIES: sunset domain-containing protein [Arthrobacter]|uniref:sunset domain-containing protein n=1 Tax=unclassified Arthrobacter TaxID=235627 RepID=UPI0024BA0DBC|nr:hypothetical protein [Arthrobacter sp. H35-MC1]MDJ0316955.1 hypothetical protein [Arthrobacter sp. H35-MC1]
MSHSAFSNLPAVGRAMFIVVTAFTLVVAMLALPTRAEAAAPSTSRVITFSAGPATVAKGKTITLIAQVQKLTAKTWVNSGSVTAAVYFDPDGSAPNKAMQAVKSSTTGYIKVGFPASVSGTWTLRLPTQGTLRASDSGKRHVKVVSASKPAPKPGSTKPVSKWNCPTWAPIKGNASSKIYHLKGQRFYLRTTPEICFSTETAAKQAGYRKSKV